MTLYQKHYIDSMKWEQERDAAKLRAQQQNTSLEKEIACANEARKLTSMDLRQYLRGACVNRNCFERVFNSCKYLVFAEANRYIEELDILTPLEIVKAGNEGLHKAIQKYPTSSSYEHGATIEQYAKWWIRYQIMQTYRQHARDTCIIIPRWPSR